MYEVKAKKYLGQHFLKDETIAERIVKSLSGEYNNILEIGPGMGVLTKYLLQDKSIKTVKVVEIDQESVEYLNNNYPMLSRNIYSEDFLKMDLTHIYSSQYAIIGNFPYNISSQILFKVFENRDIIPELVGMFQKEVAERVCAKSGTKVYGILSVLLSAYYDIAYLFTVDETVFLPPPKVKSAVIRMKRNNVASLDCDEKLFIAVVKTAFNQRRKMLRQSLKPLGKNLEGIDQELLTKRAEQLNVEQFVYITNTIK